MPAFRLVPFPGPLPKWTWGRVGRQRGASLSWPFSDGFLPSEVDPPVRCLGSVPFPSVSSRTGRASFPRTPLSSDHCRIGVVVRPAWMSSWQRRQITRVFRRRMAMRCIQAGWPAVRAC